MFHPWRTLRGLPKIDLAWLPMEGQLGATDGARVIVLHPHQSQAQRRSTLAHELAHIDLGHVDGCTPQNEHMAVQRAARWLISMQALLDALRWSEDLDELAENLWVDPETLTARLDGLTDAERQQIVDLHASVERGC